MCKIQEELTKEIMHPTLEAMKSVARTIAETFGENCEVVLHDLRHPQKSVIMVINGHVTGRKVGQPFRDLMNIMQSPNFTADHFSNYSTITKEGKMLKCSTALIRDENNDMLGALCINFDLGDFMFCKKILNDFCETKNIRATKEENVQNEDVNQILKTMISTIILETGVPVANMQKTDKIDIVRFLDERGAFLIKGSVEEVAIQLNVSRFTVYNYLDEIRSQDKKEI